MAYRSEGKLGVKEHFLSPYREGEKLTIDEYYRFIFERVPGFPKKRPKRISVLWITCGAMGLLKSKKKCMNFTGIRFQKNN